MLDITDLEINQSGHLSQRQKRMLYSSLAFWLILAVFDIIILILFTYSQVIFQRDFLTGIIGISFIIIPAYMCITNAKPYWKDIKDDKAYTASGKIYKHLTIGHGNGRGQRIGFYNIRIGNQTFSVSSSVYNYLIHEEHYRVYFVTNSRKLINIEPL